jgi:hypothetical protein
MIRQVVAAMPWVLALPDAALVDTVKRPDPQITFVTRKAGVMDVVSADQVVPAASARIGS